MILLKELFINVTFNLTLSVVLLFAFCIRSDWIIYIYIYIYINYMLCLLYNVYIINIIIIIEVLDYILIYVKLLLLSLLYCYFK